MAATQDEVLPPAAGRSAGPRPAVSVWACPEQCRAVDRRRPSPGPVGTWRGHDGYIKTHWYGIEVGLDSWLTNKVEGGFWVGAGVAGLAAALGGGPYAAAVAAALGIIAGGIQVCQHRDGWTIIYWLGSIGAGGFVCNPFG
ncbi:hypothetical protein E6W39_11985 [Kitasatospora acidiphila]|uniref:Uncharacterized protein n=1 Tax=Kitasatospora acidiphila TaxID=2567942 RepID=A0A540W1K5_9ACTN|nr:hypothetical protein [Kitasatospora acidiphila]TQF02847.1 hypothetical protein E6W39_11985 [Kitasatospora acidiphila]